jgi:hypothetical protein
MSDIKNGAPMGQSGGGIGPYDPTKETNLGHRYFKSVQKDLNKRYGKNGSGKNPPYKKGNKVAQ